MTRLLEQAIETVSTLPDDTQDELARILLQLAGVEQPPYELTPEEEADLDASLAEAERGEFATDEEVRAMWQSMACESPLHAPRAPADDRGSGIH
jgi:hypothetical protein